MPSILRLDWTNGGVHGRVGSKTEFVKRWLHVSGAKFALGLQKKEMTRMNEALFSVTKRCE
jgi:hypothetical protein